MPDSAPEPNAASEYIRSSFHSDDRLALFLLNRRTGAGIQRIAPVDKISSEAIQEWLARKNDEGFEIYIGMNVLHPDARGRTKADIGEIRHLYLDLDHDAETALDTLNNRADLPRLNHILSTSPGKLQVVWKVRDFSPEQAEGLQRQLARDVGADPAATDASRVLRLPGFLNHKYDPPYRVGLRTHHGATHSPADFPEIEERSRLEQRAAAQTSNKSRRPGELSQSEHDWAGAKRRLWSGESP